MERLRNLWKLLTHDLWRIRRSDLSPRKSFWLKQIRVIVLSLREFSRNNCFLHASALTFFTILSIVPLLAMAFGIAKGFGLARILDNFLREQLKGQEEALAKTIEFSNNLLDNARGGIVAGVGIVVLIWTVIKVLGNVEKSFNGIWGVTRPRTWARKLSDYLAFIMIAPIIIVVASGMTVMVTGKVENVVARLELWGWVGTSALYVLKIVPLSLIWALLTFTYIFMPNTKVRFRSALLGGVIAGTLYHVVQAIYLSLQIGVARYSAIYGSFAALPLFLVWIQISWLVVLLGAEISFAHQHEDTYEFEPDCLRISPGFKRLVTLFVAHRCVKLFGNGERPPSADEIARELEAPIRLVKQVLHELVEARVLSEVCADDDQDPAYQPARDTDELTVESVLRRIDEHGSNSIPIAPLAELEKLTESLETFQNLATESPANVKLKEI